MRQRVHHQYRDPPTRNLSTNTDPHATLPPNNNRRLIHLSIRHTCLMLGLEASRNRHILRDSGGPTRSCLHSYPNQSRVTHKVQKFRTLPFFNLITLNYSKVKNLAGSYLKILTKFWRARITPKIIHTRTSVWPTDAPALSKV
jgi:hypothetical protein